MRLPAPIKNEGGPLKNGMTTAGLPHRFPVHVENWQSILSSDAGAVLQAGEIAPCPEDFSRRIEEAYLDVARRHTKLVGKVGRQGLQKLS